MAPVPLDRPAWTEVVAVLVACTVLLVLLAKLDDSASQRHVARAEAKAVKVDAADRRAAEAEEERWIIATSISPAIGVHRIVGPVVRVPDRPDHKPASPARVEPVSYLPERVDSPPSEPAPIPRERLRTPIPAALALATPASTQVMAPAPEPRHRPSPMPLLMAVAATGFVLAAGGVGVLARR